MHSCACTGHCLNRAVPSDGLRPNSSCTVRTQVCHLANWCYRSQSIAHWPIWSINSHLSTRCHSQATLISDCLSASKCSIGNIKLAAFIRRCGQSVVTRCIPTYAFEQQHHHLTAVIDCGTRWSHSPVPICTRRFNEGLPITCLFIVRHVDNTHLK